MSKIEFLERLEKLLADVPYTERREALNYYTEYFEDAEKDEEEVIRTLGSPEEVAHNIREELAGKELATTDTIFESNGSTAQENDTSSNVKEEKKKTKLEDWQIVLIVIGIVLTFPIWGSAVAAIISTILGFIIAFIGIILGLAVVGVVFFIVAMVLLGVGFAHLISSPVASFFAIGLAIFLVGVSMLCLIGSWKAMTVLVPAMWRGLVYIFQSIFGRKECAAA